MQGECKLNPVFDSKNIRCHKSSPANSVICHSLRIYIISGIKIVTSNLKINYLTYLLCLRAWTFLGLLYLLYHELNNILAKSQLFHF